MNELHVKLINFFLRIETVFVNFMILLTKFIDFTWCSVNFEHFVPLVFGICGFTLNDQLLSINNLVTCVNSLIIVIIARYQCFIKWSINFKHFILLAFSIHDTFRINWRSISSSKVSILNKFYNYLCSVCVILH